MGFCFIKNIRYRYPCTWLLLHPNLFHGSDNELTWQLRREICNARPFLPLYQAVDLGNGRSNFVLDWCMDRWGRSDRWLPSSFFPLHSRGGIGQSGNPLQSSKLFSLHECRHRLSWSSLTWHRDQSFSKQICLKMKRINDNSPLAVDLEKLTLRLYINFWMQGDNFLIRHLNSFGQMLHPEKTDHLLFECVEAVEFWEALGVQLPQSATPSWRSKPHHSSSTVCSWRYVAGSYGSTGIELFAGLRRSTPNLLHNWSQTVEGKAP